MTKPCNFPGRKTARQLLAEHGPGFMSVSGVVEKLNNVRTIKTKKDRTARRIKTKE